MSASAGVEASAQQRPARHQLSDQLAILVLSHYTNNGKAYAAYYIYILLFCWPGEWWLRIGPSQLVPLTRLQSHAGQHMVTGQHMISTSRGRHTPWYAHGQHMVSTLSAHGLASWCRGIGRIRSGRSSSCTGARCSMSHSFKDETADCGLLVCMES